MDKTQQAADALRKLALNEQAKTYILANPQLLAVAKKVAKRYVAGEKLEDAIKTAGQVNQRGYSATIDFMGESTRTEQEANDALEEFLRLVGAIRDSGIHSSVSLDLSHIGSVVSKKLVMKNAHKLAEATKAMGSEMIISMEGHDRIDDILAIHKDLIADFDHVGVTIQARMHRTADDLAELLKRPGRIRLVKGAYDTPIEVAYARDSDELYTAYDRYAEQLLTNEHLCSIATHDIERLQKAEQVIERQGTSKKTYMFEFLSGLGIDQAQEMLKRGHPVQEYVVYGLEWWLYVCNRIAEEPTRLYDAMIDLATQ